MEGPPLNSFNANAAVELLWKDCCTRRRVNQNPRKDYRPRATNTTTDSHEESTSTEDTTLTLRLGIPGLTWTQYVENLSIIHMHMHACHSCAVFLLMY